MTEDKHDKCCWTHSFIRRSRNSTQHFIYWPFCCGGGIPEWLGPSVMHYSVERQNSCVARCEQPAFKMHATVKWRISLCRCLLISKRKRAYLRPSCSLYSSHLPRKLMCLEQGCPKWTILRCPDCGTVDMWACVHLLVYKEEKAFPRKSHKDPVQERRYGATLSLNSALDGVGG